MCILSMGLFKARDLDKYQTNGYNLDFFSSTKLGIYTGAVQNKQINLSSELTGKIWSTTAMQNLSDVTTVAKKLEGNPTGPL